MRRPVIVDLFSGAGGLSLGFTLAGFRPIFAADHDKYACQTYAMNIGKHISCLDLSNTGFRFLQEIVKERHKGEVDVVVGGPPCQGFSIQRRGSNRDPRNNLALRFAELATALRPKSIVLENVPTILGPRGKYYVEAIRAHWKRAGYESVSAILEAARYGVPQHRRRAFLVATRKRAFTFPEPALDSDSFVTVRDAIGDLPPPPQDCSEHPDFSNHRRVAISAINLKRLSHVPEGGGRLDIPRRLQLPCHKNNNGHRHLDVFGRMWWDKPSPTITAMFDNFTRGRFGHPSELRNITSREGARLQSFPDEFVFVGPKKDVAKQIGNAVAPLLAQAVARSLYKFLREP